MSTTSKRGLSERELQKREEQLAKLYGYEADLHHTEDSIIQKETKPKPSFNEFLQEVSSREVGRTKRKSHVPSRSPAKTLDTAFPVTPMSK